MRLKIYKGKNTEKEEEFLSFFRKKIDG